MKSKTLLLLTLTILGCSALSRNQEPAWFPAKIVMIEKEYANIDTDLTAPQLATKGITQGSMFNVKYKNHQMTALLGKDYGDVDKGKWIALIEKEGNLQIAISFGHAATEIGCAAGDTIYLQAAPPENN
jgi:S-adenosylmethionine hydrolase